MAKAIKTRKSTQVYLIGSLNGNISRIPTCRQNCNNSRYIKVPPKSMKSLWEKDCTKSLSEKQSSDLLLGCHMNITEYNSSFQEYEGGKIDINCLKTDTGAKLRFDGVIPPLFERVDQFFVCANCGKVYWIGSHMSRALEAFGDMVINDTD